MLLADAVEGYRAGRASLSELAKKTGFDVPTIMEAVAKATGEDTHAVEGFLAAVKALADEKRDPKFYWLARRALGES